MTAADVKQSLLGLREPIDARGEDGLHARRDLDALERFRRPIGAVVAPRARRSRRARHALLQEERVALRPLDQEMFERVERGIRPEQRVQEGLRRIMGQRVDAQLRVVRASAPRVPVFGAEVDEEQQVSRGQAVDEAASSVCVSASIQWRSSNTRTTGWTCVSCSISRLQTPRMRSRRCEGSMLSHCRSSWATFRSERMAAASARSEASVRLEACP